MLSFENLCSKNNSYDDDACGQSNYGILGTVISALSRSPAGPSPCSRSNSLIVDSPSQHAKLSPTNSLTVDVTGHLSPAAPCHAAVRSNSFLSVDYANHHLVHLHQGAAQRVVGLHLDTSLVTSPPNGLTSSEDESQLPPRRSRSAVVLLQF